MLFHLYDIVYENCLFRQFKVNELLFVEYKCLNDEQKLKVLSFDNFFLHVLGGRKIWQTPTANIEAIAGQTVFVKKGANIVHQFYEENFCALIIFVPDQFIIDTLQSSALVQPAGLPSTTADTVLFLETEPVLTAYFQSVFSYFGQEQKPPAALLELKFRELILCILASPHNRRLAGYLYSLCQKNKACLREVMEKNFMCNLKLEEFARLSGRSLASFKRDFLSTFHTTPGRWLLQRKLQYAKQLLEITDKNINELSFDAGFESPSHFIRLFKQRFQQTPLQYKKRRCVSAVVGPGA